MITLYDFGIKLMKIREAADTIEIKGSANAARIVFINDTCNELIREINEASEVAASNPPSDQNGSDVLNVQLQTDDTIMEEEGEMNGEPDSAAST